MNSELSSLSPLHAEQLNETSPGPNMDDEAGVVPVEKTEGQRDTNAESAAETADVNVPGRPQTELPDVATKAEPGPISPNPPEKPRAKRVSPSVPMLTLAKDSMARELVTLRQDTGGTASYERVTGNVLGRPWRRTSLFFTSTQADEGSTAVAVNIATLLSRTTESVLLVELQLTDPKLWSLFGHPPVNAGLEEALRGRARFDDCLCEIAGEKLDVLLVKQSMPAEEADRLSGALNDFLEWAEERFAWLVVDCPPVLGTSWTRWFDLNADPVVLVVGSAHAKKHELRKVLQRLGDRLSGTILNENERSQKAS